MNIEAIEDLIHLLEHRDRWPGDFEWNYRMPSRCALGLAKRVYNLNRLDELRKKLGLDNDILNDIFFGAPMLLADIHGMDYLNHSDVTPEHIAFLLKTEVEKANAKENA